MRPLSAMLTAAGVVAAVLLAVLTVPAWRVSGRAAPLWLLVAATASAILLTARLDQLAPAVPGRFGGVGTLAVVSQSGRLVGLAALVCAAVWHPVDTRLRPWVMGVVAAASLGFVSALHGLAPDALGALAGIADPAGGPSGSVPALVPVAWAVVAGLLAVQAQRRGDPILTWATLLAVTLGGAESLRQLVGTPEALLAAELASTAGILAAAGGVGAGLAGLAAVQRDQLGTARRASLAAEGRLRAADAAQAELRHEARNALAAVQAATAILHAYQDRLAAEDRAELSEAIRREVERLRLLLDEPSAAPLSAVSVARAAAPAVTGARAQGQHVEVDIPRDLRVSGRQESVAQVVSALLDNARKYAPGSTVWLRAAAHADGVVVRCEDDGPGIPLDERETVLMRGQRGRGARGDGSGLGLAVAARLIREQAGTIWIDERPGGGTSVALWFGHPSDGAVSTVRHANEPAGADADASPADAGPVSRCGEAVE